MTQNIYKIAILLFAFVAILSCEKVIDIDIKDAEIQLVVEANINNEKGNNSVILSKTGDFYDSNSFPKVKDANVTIYDKDGNTFELEETEDGVYSSSELSGISNSSYNLKIITENKTINSSSIMPGIVKLDSMSYELREGLFSGGEGKPKTFRVFCYFQDPKGEKNFYRFKVYESYKENQENLVTNDVLFDGRQAMISLSGVRGVEGDTIMLELYSIDKANYEYYRLLEHNEMGAFSTSIGNPVSNVKGEGVIGVFGANTISKDTIMIPGEYPED